MRKTKYILLLLLSAFFASVRAHNVTNVQVRQVGKSIVVYYNLDEPSIVELQVSYEVPDTASNTLSYDKYSYYLYGGGTKQDRSFTVTGDVGYVDGGSRKKIVWEVLKDYEPFIANNVQFTVTARSPYSGTKTFLLGEYAFAITPQHSGGLMFGQIYKKAGWYIHARSSFDFTQPDATTDDYSGIIGGKSGNKMPFYTGKVRRPHIMVNAGFALDLSFNRWDKSMIALYAGIGYGSRSTLWGTTISNGDYWVKYGLTSFEGISAQIGLIGAVKGFSFNVGVSTIAFQYAEMEIGIGWTFSNKVKI